MILDVHLHLNQLSFSRQVVVCSVVFRSTPFRKGFRPHGFLPSSIVWHLMPPEAPNLRMARKSSVLTFTDLSFSLGA